MTRLEKIGRYLVGIAAGLAVLASLYIFFSPLQVSSLTATSVSGAPEIVEETTTQATWFQLQGWWGIFILLLFAALFCLAYYLARIQAVTWLGILSIALVMLSYLSGFSIGLYYLPAVLLLIIGTGTMIFSKLTQSSANKLQNQDS
jgi:uncharacterized membrane protein